MTDLGHNQVKEVILKFLQVGSTAANIGFKYAKITGTTPAAGAQNSYALPDTRPGQVCWIFVQARDTSNNLVHRQETGVTNVTFYTRMLVGNTNFWIQVGAGQANIASRPFRAYIIYEA